MKRFYISALAVAPPRGPGALDESRDSTTHVPVKALTMNSSICRKPVRGRNAILASCFAAAVTAAPMAEAVTYSVTFNTASIAGTAGSVDFQWNLGTIDPSLTATVSNFGDVTLTEPPTLLFGDVSGALTPGNSLNFAAVAPFNYVYQTLSFGSSLAFSLTLPDSAPVTPDAFESAFVVSLFDSSLNPALPTTSPDGAALVFALAPGEAPVLTQFGASSVSAVPEPETYVLMLIGLATIGYCSRRRAG